MSSDVDIQPGSTEKWGLGFLINTTAYAGGRSAGSLAWAGIDNTFYWIDPKKAVCGVLMMQFLPFVDKEAVGATGGLRTCCLQWLEVKLLMRHSVSRRALLRLASASSTLPLTASPADTSVPRPFHIAIPQATVDRILARVREARWPDRLDADDWRYGANWDYMKQLAAYWTSRYDWRKAEARLNTYPQFKARVEDFDIHFYHVRGSGPRPVPLILTHGWPGSVLEFLDAIGPLTDPASFGGSAEDAFDVVVPSLPGFGFSSKPKGKPVGPPTTARLWHKLMTQTLGYSRYGAQGGDWGAFVTMQLARSIPGRFNRNPPQLRHRSFGSRRGTKRSGAHLEESGGGVRQCGIGLCARASQQALDRGLCAV